MMKLRPTLAASATIAALFFAMSCATPPTASETPAPPAPAPAKVEPAPAVEPAKPSVPAPNELSSKAAALRKKAFDLGLKEVLVEDYAAAEKAYAAGGAEFGKDNEASTASFTDAVAKFEDVIARGLPILAAAERKRAEGLRETALAKHAAELFPELVAFAEAELSKPSGAQEAGDFEEALKGFRDAAKNFEVLYKLCDANTAREAIMARDFAKWDTSNWSLAETRFTASKDLLPSDATAAAASVDEALLRYGIASRTALEYYASDRKKSSEGERDRAAGIKSEVAVKEEYAAALELHSQAETSQAAKDFEASSSLYDRAASAFAVAYEHAKVKMDNAKGELESLDEAIAAKADSAGVAR